MYCPNSSNFQPSRTNPNSLTRNHSLNGRLFEDNINVIAEMIDWMLIPKHLIKQKKIKSNVEGYPYNSKEFMK